MAHSAEAAPPVVVIYNQRMPESKAVADYYASQRHVPANQLVGLKLPTSETITRTEYTEQLEKPLLQALLDRGLFTFAQPGQLASSHDPTHPKSRVVSAKVRYAALCYGVPTRILESSNLAESDLDALPPPLRRNGAAVDSELACLPMAQPRRLTGPLPNPAFAATNQGLLHPTNGILLVTRLDGPSPAIARRLVDLAREAETNGLWGRAYFDTRGITNGEYVLGDNWLRAAAALARRLGFETVLDERPETFPPGFPMSHIALYAGWYDGHVSGPLVTPRVEFMPGAFAYHLHSFSAAAVRSTNLHWVGPLLARGATATMGAVDEPYLAGTPDIALFLVRWIYLGFSFGEAAWAAQNVLSWQNLAVGDPLYRPFGRRPDVLHAELEQRVSKLLEWSHLRIVNVNLATGVSPKDAIDYLEALPLTRKSAVLTEKLADLCWAEKRPSDALALYERALRLDPSPQQKLRLLLTLGQRRAVYGSIQAAVDSYLQLLNEFPDYPNALQVYQALLPLAKRLDNKALIDRCEQQIQKLAPSPSPQSEKRR
jgi:uncharacterized protein (TIGR03790 family)